MFMKYICFFLIIFLAISCKRNIDQQSFDQVNIFVEDSLYNYTRSFLLSKVVENISIIPLETKKESVFNNRIFSFSIGEKDLFINSYLKIYHFSVTDNKYIGQIGSLGNGPSDFNYAGSVGIDDRSKLIYVYSGVQTNNEMKTYTYEGKFLKSIHMAPAGAHMEGGFTKGEYRGSLFVNNKHIVRRMLPIMDGSKDIWQIGIFDTAGKKIVTFVDPANVKYRNDINRHRAVKRGYEVAEMATFWDADSPVLNQYFDHVNILFDSNDTIYRYNSDKNTLRPRYILHCGDRPPFEEIRTLGKKKSYFQYIFVTNVLETKDFLFLVAEKDNNSFLLRVDMKTGDIKSIKNEGKITELSSMRSYDRKATPPGFTNDLCGGMPFFPRFQNEKQWIAIYTAEELLEQVDIEKLKKEKVLYPEKRDQLVKILENLKEDDNSVIMVANLK